MKEIAQIERIATLSESPSGLTLSSNATGPGQGVGGGGGGTSLVAQLVKNLPGFDSWVRKIPQRSSKLPSILGLPWCLSKESTAVWETWVQSLSWEDPLEQGMATHSSILVWRIPMDKGA